MSEPLADFRAITPPPEVVVPMLSGGRAIAAGTLVRVGDLLIRQLPVELVAPLPRAPLAGTVIGERQIQLTDGTFVDGCIIQVETFPAELAPRLIAKPFAEDINALLATRPGDLAGWLKSLLNAGVWANRSTCPNLHGQLRDSFGADTVLCTILDPDAHVGISARLGSESPADLLAGAVLTARLANAQKLLIVVEPTVPDRIKRELARLCGEVNDLAHAAGVSLAVRAISYAHAYPAGDTSLLLLNLLSRKLPPGGLPTSRGAVLLDAAAADAIGQVARHDAMLTTIPLAVSNHAAPGSPMQLLRVPLGTPVSHLVEQAGLKLDKTEIRASDVLQELIVPPAAVISPADLYLHLLPKVAAAPPDPCVRCGWCVEACPTGVHPAAVLEAAQLSDAGQARAANVHACIECGLCQYVCPSRLPLLTALRRFTRKAGAVA